jgi:uncharacterized protein (DUF1778 family)
LSAENQQLTGEISHLQHSTSDKVKSNSELDSVLSHLKKVLLEKQRLEFTTNDQQNMIRLLEEV